VLARVETHVDALVNIYRGEERKKKSRKKPPMCVLGLKPTIPTDSWGYESINQLFVNIEFISMIFQFIYMKLHYGLNDIKSIYTTKSKIFFLFFPIVRSK
jgi:hypothetical protein